MSNNHRVQFFLLVCSLLTAACGDDSPGLIFPGGFHWGAATAAHQTEGGNTNNNWYQFETLPRFKGKTKEPSAKAADSYNRYEEDIQIARDMGLNSYRFSIEWSRIEPQRDVWDEAALTHYDKMIDAVKARALRPVVTLHHFTDPIWVHDLSRLDDCDKPAQPIDDTNLCGWSHTEVRDEWVEFVEKVVQRYGDRVDYWITINEPMAYLYAGYMFGVFPPGKMFQSYDEVVLPALRNMVSAHARAYDAIHKLDTKDADGDSKPAVVGVTQSVAYYEPAQPARKDDRDATRQAEYFMNFLFTDALVKGGLDTKLDYVLDEPHSEWKGKLDFVGLQYYFRAATTKMMMVRPVFFIFCMKKIEEYLPGALENLGCPKLDPNSLTLMGYEHYPEGIYKVIKAFDARYPGLPLMITENGISTRSGRRRAESLVRHLEWVHRALEEGIDLRGYYHWSLIDNFEWADGYHQRFGLYSVDFATFKRSPTEGATVEKQILDAGGQISSEVQEAYGGSGPLSAELPLK